jgi:hypothetical protein
MIKVAAQSGTPVRSEGRRNEWHWGVQRSATLIPNAFATGDSIRGCGLADDCSQPLLYPQ